MALDFRAGEPFSDDEIVAHRAREDWTRIFDRDRDQVIVLNPTGAIVVANPAWLARAALDQSNPPGSINYFEMLLVTGRPVAIEIAAALSELLDGDREEYAVEESCEEGEPARWVSLHAYPWIHEGERWAVVRTRDVPGRNAEHERASILSVVLDEVDAAAIVTDMRRYVISWSAGAHRMYGYTADEATGARLEDLIAPPGDAAELGCERLDDRGRSTGRRSHRRRDGSPVAVELRVRRLPDRSGRPAQLAFIASSVAS